MPTSAPPTTPDADWAAQEAAAALRHVASSEAGLSAAEADARLRRDGPNTLPVAKRRSPVLRFLAQFDNLLIYVLLAAGLLTAALGEWTDAGVIAAVVLINAVIGFIQEGKAEDAIAAVRNMLSVQAMVLRDGHRQTIAAEAVVRGDILVLQSGDKVAADVRLIRAKSLQVQEAVLTGESLPVEKDVAAVAAGAALGDRASMAFSGTVVTYGQGIGVVVATGTDTEIGRIGSLLAGVDDLATPLTLKMAAFGRWLTLIILVLAGLVFGVGAGVWSFPPTEMFMAAVSLAVAAIPEELPVIITIAFAIGVQRMARRNAIIRRLPAVETLGSVTVICTDKTGTLTRNELTVRAVDTASGHYAVSGTGYEPHGAFSRDGVDLDAAIVPDLAEALKAAALCNDAGLVQRDGVWLVDGDPTEGALLAAALKSGLDHHTAAKEYPRTDEIPFEAQHRLMATLHHDHVGNGFIYVKGAPERLLGMCAEQYDARGSLMTFDAGPWVQRTSDLANKGQRVLAVAMKRTTADHRLLTFADLEHGFVFLGLFGLMDPPRDDAAAAIADCQNAGIAVKMITGDHAATAAAIAAELRLPDSERVLTGQDFAGLSDAELSLAVEDTAVFARTSPEDKLRLVGVLQNAGHVVAMTGDGVNDAPALKRADIGIAMGVKGTEAAKDASEMVLADDNFSAIAKAVREGRAVYQNLQKTILYVLPTNGGEALAIVGSILFGAVLPVTPLQILWINLVTTVVLGLALAFERPEADIMRVTPRSPTAPLVSGYAIWRIALVSVLMVAATIGLFQWQLARGADLATARTVAVNVLVGCEMTYLFCARYLMARVLSCEGLFGSKPVLLAVAVVAALQLAFTYTPWLRALFDTTPLALRDWLEIGVVSFILMVIVELDKAVARRMSRGRNIQG